MEKVVDKVKSLMSSIGVKVSNISFKEKEGTVFVKYYEGYNDVFTKYIFVGRNNNLVSVHDNKVCIVLDGDLTPNTYCTVQLREFDRYFLARPLPSTIVVEGKEYKIRYIKDIWGW